MKKEEQEAYLGNTIIKYPKELEGILQDPNIFEWLENILNPTSYTYNMSIELFYDVWKDFGKPEVLNNPMMILEFFESILEKSDGLVILDHFSLINYDNISSIEYKKPFFEICWRNFDGYSEKLEKNELNEFEVSVWNEFDRSSPNMICNIRNLKFKEYEGRLIILVMTNLIVEYEVKSYMLEKGHNKNSINSYKEDLYFRYDTLNENKEKSTFVVNNFPYYSFLIQPKEQCFGVKESKKILLNETLNEIEIRMKKVFGKIKITDEYDYDELTSAGNTIRKILEYSLKLMCIYNEIELKDIDKKYGYITLGDLNKVIKKSDLDIDISTEIIILANEFSHDSGKNFTKETVISFWEQSNVIIDKVCNFKK